MKKKAVKNKKRKTARKVVPNQNLTISAIPVSLVNKIDRAAKKQKLKRSAFMRTFLIEHF